CAVMRNDFAAKAFFTRRAGALLDDPTFPDIEPIKLTDKIESAQVTLYFGLQEQELKLGVCKLKDVTLAPQAGGMTEMSCKVQAPPKLDKSIGELIDHMDAGVRIAIEYEHDAEQKELPMGQPALTGAHVAQQPTSESDAEVDEAISRPPQFEG